MVREVDNWELVCIKLFQRTESIDKFLMMVGTQQVVDEDGLQVPSNQYSY